MRVGRSVEESFRITNNSGDRLTGDLRVDAGSAPKPVVIVCHGFTAHKDWGPFPRIGRQFVAAGFASVVFNFSHNGVGVWEKRFTEYEKFARNTVGKELEDVRAVVDALERGDIGKGTCDPGRVAILGHSRGGAVGILAASEDSRVRAVAAWSTISTFFRYTAHQVAAWREHGYLPIHIRSMRTRLRRDVRVLDDLEAHRERYDLIRAVRRLQVPLLLVHGKGDLVVKPREAEELQAAADASKCELVLIEHAGHLLGAGRTRAGIPDTLDRVIGMTIQWFQRHLIGDLQ